MSPHPPSSPALQGKTLEGKAENRSEKKAEKSYLAAAVDSINPWAGGRNVLASSATPPQDPQPLSSPSTTNDHSTSHIYGRSSRRYPPDCPLLRVQWFHAVDVAKRKPEWLMGRKSRAQPKKPSPSPKKYVAFSPGDSNTLEKAYQAILEASEDERVAGTCRWRNVISHKPSRDDSGDLGRSEISTDGHCDARARRREAKVPVNEDFLFDVDIEKRELAPVYWLGPIYDVRRGSWFYQDGSALRPCEENLAAQLEEGYLKVKPWLYPDPPQTTLPKGSADNVEAASAVGKEDLVKSPPTPHQPQTYRLFGTYMNHIATYQDANVAWLSSDTVLSWVTSTVYERFGSGGYTSGMKLVRGYAEPNKARENKRPSTPTGTKSDTLHEDDAQKKLLKRRSAPPSTTSALTEDAPNASEAQVSSTGLSDLMDPEKLNPDAEEEAIRKRDEKEIQNDYHARQGETQGREIEHLVLVTHGIGQLLGLRMESVNFVHDINVLRQNLKTVYSTSADLRALNSDTAVPADSSPGNCRIQVLPLCWRHLLEFPKKREKKTKELDLGAGPTEEDEYPSLDDITIEGVAFARSLISDLALDVLLYQSAYRDEISDIVLREANRIYRLFMDRHPDFTGKVHLAGHSLGSAILFDILCRQPSADSCGLSSKPRTRGSHSRHLDFDVHDFYCLGSPVGLFQMLKGRTIAARPPSKPHHISPASLDLSSDIGDSYVFSETALASHVSSLNAAQLFNIFHPSDPIAYRLEPLISPAMSALKPQALPYTKKGIFGNVAPQGLTGLGAKVGQSVSGLWSSLSAGIANNILNRSLGISQEDVDRLNADVPSSYAASPGAGTNISGGVIYNPNTATGADTDRPSRSLSDARRGEMAEARKKQLADGLGRLEGRPSISGNEATLIDDELETLFSRFQKRDDPPGGGEDGSASDRAGGSPSSSWIGDGQKVQRLRREENKVRALNRNGRVDYCIQESVLDFSPINTIASHMSYWADEDVSHFVMSQLLSNKTRRRSETN